MKLEVWKEAVDLVRWLYALMGKKSAVDFKLRSQMLNAAQSISSNIAEGYCRRSIREYLQFLDIALGSSGELMTRMIGFEIIEIVSKESFDEFDIRHFSIENKLLALTKSLQAKRRDGSWIEEL